MEAYAACSNVRALPGSRLQSDLDRIHCAFHLAAPWFSIDSWSSGPRIPRQTAQHMPDSPAPGSRSTRDINARKWPLGKIEEKESSFLRVSFVFSSGQAHLLLRNPLSSGKENGFCASL